MGIESLENALVATSLSHALQTTDWAIPLIQTVHILTLSVLFGAALVLCLRIHGKGISATSLEDLGRRLPRAIWVAIAILAISGSMLIVAEPSRTLTNPVFYAKLSMLAVAVVLTLRLQGATRSGAAQMTGSYKLLAVLSMVLWIGIIFAGRLIAYAPSF